MLFPKGMPYDSLAASAAMEAVRTTMTEQPKLLSFAPAEWRSKALALIPATRGRLPIGRTLTSAILGTCLLLLSVARAEAAMITWHWAGPVTGHIGSPFGGPSLDTVVPLGTTVDVFVSLDPDAAYLNPAICLQGIASASLQVLGRTYTNQGFVWVDAFGFGGGICAPGSDRVEIVVPSWGAGGPALPNGWVPFNQDFLPGLWWGGDLTSGQPAFINSQFPFFYIPGEAARQRFTANLQAVPDLQAVPEPSTWLLLSIGLSAAAARRGFKRPTPPT